MRLPIAPSLLGRLYSREREYVSALKRLVKSYGYKKVPVELRNFVKEQAWEQVRQQELDKGLAGYYYL